MTEKGLEGGQVVRQRVLTHHDHDGQSQKAEYRDPQHGEPSGYLTVEQVQADRVHDRRVGRYASVHEGQLRMNQEVPVYAA